MPGFCTCGAQLPEDARFCHKCGKPQRDEPQFEEPEEIPEAAAPPVVSAPPVAPRIGFHNRAAVNAALVSGIAGFLISVLTGKILPAASSLGLIAAGFLSVYLYQRRTGQRLSITHGAHLGWISGVFGFVITLAILAVVVTVLSDQSVVDSVRQQLQGSTAEQQAQLDQMLQIIHNRSYLLAAVAVSFLLFTVFPAFGGALGAKFLDRQD